MDRAGVKRPRSGTPESKNKKDKNKKKKKAKLNPKQRSAEATNHSNNDEDKANSNSMESTATADGQYMAKILSTFSKLEQSRFEAFKRVSFPCRAVAQYVAHCLSERQRPSPLERPEQLPQQPVFDHHPQSENSHAATTFHNGHKRHPPPIRQVFSNGDQGGRPQLEDLVVPGQEEEITTVVATLAKAYAQRLCAAAKAQAVASSHAGGIPAHTNHSAADPAAATAPSPDAVTIQPQHVLQAFHQRSQQGQDPGFFLQPNDSIVTVGSAMNNDSKEQLKRVAALAAQEEFQKCLEEYESSTVSTKSGTGSELQQHDNTTGETSSTSGNAAAGDAPVPMATEDDSDSGDEAEVDLVEQEKK